MQTTTFNRTGLGQMGNVGSQTMKNGLLLSLVTMVVTALFPAFASAQEPLPTVKLATSEVSLGRILPGADGSSLTVSPDSRHMAYVVRRGGRLLVVVDGVEGKEYDGTGHGSLVFSPDGKRVAYAAKRGGNSLVVVDEVEGKGYDHIGEGSLVFSPDGTRVAYAAGHGNKRLVVVDGVEGKEYHDIGEGSLAFSPDGRRVAYTAKRGGNSLIVVDGVEGKEYDGIGVGTPIFSPDGRRVAYGAKRGGNSLVVVDEAEGKEFDHIGEGSLVFSPDGRRVAYTARRGGNSLVVVDGTEEKGYDDIGEGSLVFSPDGRRVAYAARRGVKSLVVLDGVEGKEYDGIGAGTPIFSPDGRHVAYSASRGDKQLVVVDGVEKEEYDGIVQGCLVFSPDSRRVAYAGRRGIKPPFKSLVVVDGVEGKEYDGLVEGSLVFSPDSAHLTYWAGRADKAIIVVDGAEAPQYDAFLRGSSIVFDGRRSFHALALRGGEVFRVHVEINEAIAGPRTDTPGPHRVAHGLKPVKCDPADLEALSGTRVRWAGSVTKLETDGHECTVLLSSKEDERGNKTLYVVSLPVPKDTGAKLRVGDSLVFEGVLLLENTIVEETGYFKNYFDRVSEKTFNLGFALPTILSVETNTDNGAATAGTVEAIETTIAISIKPFSFNPCPISDRLQGLIEKYDSETVLGVAMAGYAATMKEKGVAIKLKDDWGMPFAFKSDKLPEVRFRKGEIGIVAEEIYVKEETEALVGGKTYRYKGQKWLAVEGQAAAKTRK